MPVIEQIAAFHDEMTSWRHHIHAHPETAFEEHSTAAFIARQLSSLGLRVHEGLARTGVIGTLTTGGGRAIGLRADMDALPIAEAINSLIVPGARAGCTRAATMATPPCCWAPPGIWRRPEGSAARYISSSSRPKRPRAAGVS